MNCITPTIPTQVFDIEDLQRECFSFDIQPTRSNIRRVRKALTIVDAPNAIQNLANFTDEHIYSVQSQRCTDTRYIVRSNNESGVECTCMDYAQGNICKHSLAVRIYEERLEDQAKYDAWLCEQYEQEQAVIDNSLAQYDPEVDFPFGVFANE